MHLPEFILLVVATLAAIAASLAVVASSFRAAQVFTWIAGLSFGSLGIAWALQSHGYSLVTQIIVAAVCGAIGAGGLAWGLHEIKTRASAADPVKPSAPPTPPAGKNNPNFTAGRDVHIGHIGDVTNNPPPPKAPQDVGVLVPRVEPLLANGVIYRDLEVGDSGATIRSAGLPGSPLLSMATDYNLTLEIVDGRLAVSTQVRDKSGGLVAELIRNEWKVAPPPQIWDRNYSDDALEIIGPDGHVIIQVHVLPDRVRLQGEWQLPNGKTFQLVKNPDPTKAGFLFVFFVPETEAKFRRNIPRMFKYPSQLHFGELAR